MWKKSEAAVSSQTTTKNPTPARPEGTGTRKARIGVGILLKGELYGEEDVIIEGRVEGKITLKQHGVIIEESGRVDADITASSICVAGEVHGNLHGTGASRAAQDRTCRGQYQREERDARDGCAVQRKHRYGDGGSRLRREASREGGSRLE